MGRSRYAGNEVFDADHYGTWVDPVSRNPLGPDVLDGVTTVDHVIEAGQRLDVLAYKYYGDPDYWWVIALANRIIDPFSLTVGQLIRIPSNVLDVLNKVR